MPQESVKTTINQRQDGVYVEFGIEGKGSVNKQLFFMINNTRFNSIVDIEKVVKTGKSLQGKILSSQEKRQFRRSLEKIRSYLKDHNFKERDEMNSKNPGIKNTALEVNCDILNAKEFSREIIRGFMLELSSEWLKYIFTTPEIKKLIGNNFRFSDQDLAKTLNEVRFNVLSDDSCDTLLAKNLVIIEEQDNNLVYSSNTPSAPPSPKYKPYNQLDSFDKFKMAFIQTIHCPEIMGKQTRAMIMANRLDEIGNELKSLDLYEINPETGEMKLDKKGHPIKKEDFSKQTELDDIINKYFQNFYHYLSTFTDKINGIAEVEAPIYYVPEKNRNAFMKVFSCSSSKSTQID